MIQELLTTGSYDFNGDLNDLKKCVNSFKITKTITMGEIQGIRLCEVYGKFKYKGAYHKVHIQKYWDRDVLKIDCIGKGNER